MKELISLINEFQIRDVGFRSLHDAIDTTTAQGQLIFKFASLTVFDRTGEPAGINSEKNQAGILFTYFYQG